VPMELNIAPNANPVTPLAPPEYKARCNPLAAATGDHRRRTWCWPNRAAIIEYRPAKYGNGRLVLSRTTRFPAIRSLVPFRPTARACPAQRGPSPTMNPG